MATSRWPISSKSSTRRCPRTAEKKCTEEEAQKVAAYIRETFYTAEARARHRPPVIDPARLTVRQYSQVVADLLATSSDEPTIGDERGLKGDYYKSRNTRRNERVFDRIDPKIDFNFADGSPETEKIKPEEFSMRWDGSLLVDETGDYEFSIKSENGVRLWVNNPDKALIDEWVSSGEVREPIQSLRLLGGRAYPIRVQFFKFKDKSASVVLRWKTPSGVWEVIPARHLVPRSVPRTFVVTTPFPADDGSAATRAARRSRRPGTRRRPRPRSKSPTTSSPTSTTSRTPGPTPPIAATA